MQGSIFSLDTNEAVTVLANWSRTKVSPNAAAKKKPGEGVMGQAAADP